MQIGIVLKSTGVWYELKSENGQKYQARLRGKLRLKGLRTTNPIAVGDRVEFESVNEGQVLIHNILPRKNFIIRKSVNLSKEAHIIASNIDLALLFITLKQPDTSTGFIDRFLVTAKAYGVAVALIFNKIDIYTEKELIQVNELIKLYERIGYPSYKTSATESINLDEIDDLTADKTIMLAGHSGTGKSTLINSLNPNIDIRTDEISESHFKGKHTTTFAEMHEMGNGGFIIDTPGIKGFGLIDLNKENLHHYIPEIFNKLPECKFHNCRHINEPKCAVKVAVQEGEIAESRYKNYLKMYEEEDSPYRTTGYH